MKLHHLKRAYILTAAIFGLLLVSPQHAWAQG